MDIRLLWQIELPLAPQYFHFEARLCEFYGNTREGAEPDDEWRLAAFDGLLPRELLQRGFVPIGRPDTGGFDRICFGTRRPSHRHEWPIVRVGHESADCRVSEVVAPSFYKFTQAIVGDVPRAST